MPGQDFPQMSNRIKLWSGNILFYYYYYYITTYYWLLLIIITDDDYYYNSTFPAIIHHLNLSKQKGEIVTIFHIWSDIDLVTLDAHLETVLVV